MLIKITFLFLFALLLAGPAWADTEVTDSTDVSGDDAFEHVSNSFYVVTTYDRFGDYSGCAANAGLRFDSLGIPQGATISSAIVTFVSAGNDAGTVCNLVIYCEDTADASTFSSSTDWGNRVWTSASVSWSAVPAWSGGTSYSTPNIASCVQEVVNRADWSTNNGLVVGVFDNSSDTDAQRVYRTYDYGSQFPYITIDYTEAGGASSQVIIIGGH